MGEHKLAEEDAWALYEVVEVLHDFLHRSDLKASVPELEAWLQGGGYEELKRLYYQVVGPWFPVDDSTGEVVPPDGLSRRLS